MIDDDAEFLDLFAEAMEQSYGIGGGGIVGLGQRRFAFNPATLPLDDPKCSVREETFQGSGRWGVGTVKITIKDPPGCTPAAR